VKNENEAFKFNVFISKVQRYVRKINLVLCIIENTRSNCYLWLFLRHLFTKVLRISVT